MEDKITKKTRGFEQLIGSRIALIDAGALNEITMVDEDGSRFIIEVEKGPFDIPVISLNKVDADYPARTKLMVKIK